MVPFVLPVILQVTEKSKNEDFVEHILPHLKPIMKITEPIQVMLQLMQKMDLLLSKTPPEDVRSDVLPLLYRALESETQQIQELCLTVIPTCAPLVDAPTMKNSILSRIRKLCLSTSYLSVRVNCLVCVGKLLEHLDKWLIVDEIFPFLVQVPSKEAPVIMATVGILKVTLHHQKLGISKEVLATKVLPFIFPLSIENSLSPSQHASIMGLIREMTDQVEKEHKSKLEHLNSIKDEQKSLQMNMPTPLSTSTSSQPSSQSTSELDNMFNGLGLGQYVSGSGSTNTSKATTPEALSSPTSNKSASNLSLEDKQRIAKQQSFSSSTGTSLPPLLPSPPAPAGSSTPRQSGMNTHKLSGSGSLAQSPTTPQPKSSAAQPRDLTSSLISSNLNMMKHNTPAPTPQTTIPASVSFMNSMNTLRTLNTMNSMNTSNQSLISSPNSSMMITSNGWGGGGTISQHSTIMGNNVTSMGVNSQQPTMTGLATFNAIMQQQAQQQAVGLNQMTQMSGNNSSNPMAAFSSMAPLQPISLNNSSMSNTSSSSSFKPLSSSDINDFLS